MKNGDNMTAIKTESLTKKFKDIVAVDSLNLSVERGELFSLLGINGAGKTTTIKMLSCLSAPTGGNAFLAGKSILSNSREIKEIISISPQETAVARNLSVLENLEFIAGIYSVDRKEAHKRALTLIDELGLEDVRGKRAKLLSGGMQRRLSIAMSLITKPEILFLDEPTLGIDVIARRELWDVIKKLKGKITIILTTHYMEEAQELSDRVGIMSRGRLTATGTPAELMEKTNSNSFEDAFVKLASEQEGRTQ